MKFKIKTLVDVTQTNARKGDDSLLTRQQANFMTLYNTIGLRSNPTDFIISAVKEDVAKLFGSSFKGKKTVWNVEFNIEAVDSLTVEMLEIDFDLVPFIANLTEDAKFTSNVFRTKDPENTNIIFELLDK